MVLLLGGNHGRKHQLVAAKQGKLLTYLQNNHMSWLWSCCVDEVFHYVKMLSRNWQHIQKGCLMSHCLGPSPALILEYRSVIAAYRKLWIVILLSPALIAFITCWLKVPLCWSGVHVHIWSLMSENLLKIFTNSYGNISSIVIKSIISSMAEYNRAVSSLCFNKPCYTKPLFKIIHIEANITAHYKLNANSHFIKNMRFEN